MNLILGALVIAGAVTLLVVEHNARQRLHDENARLHRQIAQLQSDNAVISNRLAQALDVKSLSEEQLGELLRLRAEVTRLSAQPTAVPPAAPAARPATNPAAAASPNTATVPTTRELRIRLLSKFVSVPTASLSAMGVDWTASGRGSGKSVLTEQQFQTISQAMRGASDTDTIGSPALITPNGQKAVASSTRPVSVNGVNANIGVILNATPVFSTNSFTFDLNLAAVLTELTGQPAKPGIRKTQVAGRMTLKIGQTALLAQEIPPGGWIPNSTNSLGGRRSLLVFVTPRLVDGGNPPH